MTNLLTNALKHTDAPGSVTIRVREESNAVLVQVEDTGKGIPAELLERIFDKFVQVNTSGGPGGVGLGLAIAKEIVELYRGRIWAESEPGKGSTFSFTLPLRQLIPADNAKRSA
jgi:signal transduction histidine kinase